MNDEAKEQSERKKERKIKDRRQTDRKKGCSEEIRPIAEYYRIYMRWK